MANSNETQIMPVGAQLVDEGKTLTKIEAGYQTAVKVQKPRILNKVIDRCLAEADLAGESFYWTWTVYNRRTGKEEMVEGPSIDLAMTVARNYGNCAVPTEVTEIEGEWVFRAAFVDLETGFTFQRVYRKRQTSAPGRYDQDRWDDMQFQAAQSRAQRNAIIKAVPAWLVEQVMDRAKEATLKGIGKMGKEKIKTKLLKFFMRYQVDKKMLENLTGEETNNWTEDILVNLCGIARTLQDGQETVESIFGRAKVETKKDENVELVEEFWKHIEGKGIGRDDKDMPEYVKSISEFYDMTEVEAMAQAAAGFREDPGQIDKFVESFRKKYPEQEKQKPQKDNRKKDKPDAKPTEEEQKIAEEEEQQKAAEYVPKVRPDLLAHIREKLPHLNDIKIMKMMLSRGMVRPEKMTDEQVKQMFDYVDELYRQKNSDDE